MTTVSALVVATSGAEDNQHEEQHYRTRPDGDADARPHSDRVFRRDTITQGQPPDILRWVVSSHHSMPSRGFRCVDGIRATGAGYRSMQTAVKEQAG